MRLNSQPHSNGRIVCQHRDLVAACPSSWHIPVERRFDKGVVSSLHAIPFDRVGRMQSQANFE